MPRGEAARPRSSRSGHSTCVTRDFPLFSSTLGRPTSPGEPFVALSTELMEGLDEYKGSVKKYIARMKMRAKEVLRRTVPSVTQLATAAISEGEPIGKEIGEAVASYAEARLTEYPVAQKSLKEFRRVLQDMATALSTQRAGRPLIVVIDELDRCRPSYAVSRKSTSKNRRRYPSASKPLP